MAIIPPKVFPFAATISLLPINQKAAEEYMTTNKVRKYNPSIKRLKKLIKRGTKSS